MKRLGWLFLSLLALTCANRTHALTPEQTKNTVLIGDNIEPIFKYGVQIGEVYIETHIIENMARFAPDGAIKDLLNGLFNVTTEHFRTPDYSSIFGYHITPKIIGRIIDLVFKQKKDKDFILSNIKVKKKSQNGFNEFVERLFLALEEEKNSSFYEENTVIKILYGFLYKKNKDKNNIEPYFNELCKNDAFKNANPTIQKDWPKNFAKKELVEAKIKKNEMDFAKIIAIGIQQNWLCQDMPELFEYKTVNSKKHKIAFSDCFETTLRNLCNILAYYNLTFSAEALATQLDIEKNMLPQAIQSFYTNNPENKDTKAIHTAWLDDVLQTNIPYAMYNRVIDNNKNIKRGKTLYIHIPSTSTLIEGKKADNNDFYDIEINGKKYKAFTEKSGWFGYELEPCTYELIIVLNHILGLNLFKNKNIEEEITKKNFEKDYIDNLMKAFNAESYNKDISYDIDLYTITLDKKRAFEIKIEKGEHAATLPIKTKKTSRKNQKIIKEHEQIKNNTIAKKILHHGFDLTKYTQKKNENIFRRTMTNNLGKIEAIKGMSEFNIDKQKELVIRNIIKKFHLVEGDWNDYEALITNIDAATINNPLNGSSPEVQNKNTKIKNIINEEIALLYAKQLENNPTNADFIESGIKKAPKVFEKAIIALKDIKDKNQSIKDMLLNKKEDGMYLLQYAIGYSQPEIAKLIINELKNTNDNEKILKNTLLNKDKNDYNLLQQVIFHNQPEVAKLIINGLKDINDNEKTLKNTLLDKDKKDRDSLRWTIECKRPKIAKLIINGLKNINDNKQSLKKALLDKDKYGQDSLKWATDYEQPKIVKLILNELNDINDNNLSLRNALLDKNEFSYNALGWAIECNQPEIAQLIINELKNINDNEQTLKNALLNESEWGHNALKNAQDKGLSKIVGILKKEVASINRYKWIPWLAGATTFVITSLIQKLLQKNTTTKSLGYGALAAAIAYSTSRLKINKTKGLPTIRQQALNVTLSTTLGTTTTSLLAKYGPALYKKIRYGTR